MTRATVGVLRGGTSNEYDSSLKTGAAVLAALPDDRYDARDIFIDKRGFWHARGVPADPVRILSQLDVVIPALHGGIGEDGSVHRILDRAGVPYAGSDALATTLAYNKLRAGAVLRGAGIRMPHSFGFTHSFDGTSADMARAVFASFGPPYVVKPAAAGSGHGIRIAHTLVELPDLIADVLDEFGAAMVEEFVRGKEAVVGIIEDFRDEPLYALPPARVLLPEDALVLDTQARTTATHIAPGDFFHNEKQELMAVARAAHKALQLSHFSRADIIVTARGVPYLLEVNTMPKLHEGTVLPQMLDAVGSSVPAFLEHAINLARRS